MWGNTVFVGTERFSVICTHLLAPTLQTSPTPTIRNATACSQGFCSGSSIFNPASSRVHFNLPECPSSSTFSILPGACLLLLASAAITACSSGQPMTNAYNVSAFLVNLTSSAVKARRLLSLKLASAEGGVAGTVCPEIFHGRVA